MMIATSENRYCEALVPGGPGGGLRLAFFGNAMSSPRKTITTDMHRTMIVRFMSMLHVKLSGLNRTAGRRQSTAINKPIATFDQCSLSAAASNSSCDKTDNRCVVAVLGAGMGVPDGAPAVLAAFALAKLVALFLDAMLPPPRFLPMLSRNICIITTMPTSSTISATQTIHSPTVHAQPALALTKSFGSPA
jgi:hypothetical protein